MMRVLCDLTRRCTQPSDRKSTRLNSSHGYISYAVFCLKKKNPLRFAMFETSLLQFAENHFSVFNNPYVYVKIPRNFFRLHYEQIVAPAFNICYSVSTI